MPSPRRRRMAALTFLFAGLSVAPAAPSSRRRLDRPPWLRPDTTRP